MDIKEKSTLAIKSHPFYQQGYLEGYKEGIRQGNDLIAEAMVLQVHRYIFCEHCSENVVKNKGIELDELDEIIENAKKNGQYG